jgi:hypothetical protein
MSGNENAEGSPPTVLDANSTEGARAGKERPTPHTHQAEPIGAYVGLASAFLGLTCAAVLWLRHSKLILPKPNTLDVALIGLGTARLSRLITRDKVMRPLRAPFTVSERTVPGEAKERAKGSGLIRATGELMTCPRCTAIWAASGLCLTYFASPSVGRVVATILSSSFISDFANHEFALLSHGKRES